MNQVLIAILIFIGAATLAYADELTPAEISHCSNEIGQAERFIQKQGADSVSAEMAKKASQICQTEFSNKELNYFQKLSGSCDTSFDGIEGTASKAMHFICHMNAARFVMSLQLPTNTMTRSQTRIQKIK